MPARGPLCMIPLISSVGIHFCATYSRSFSPGAKISVPILFNDCCEMRWWVVYVVELYLQSTRGVLRKTTWGRIHPSLCVKEENSLGSLGFPAEGNFSFSLKPDTHIDPSGHLERKQFLRAQNPSGLNCKDQLHHLFIDIVFCQSCFICSSPVPLLATEENPTLNPNCSAMWEWQKKCQPV